MEKIIIRKVEPTDNKGLSKLIKKTFEEHDAPREGTVFSDPTTDHLYELFQTEGSVLWVGELDGHMAGCCGIYPTQGLPEGCAELVKFYLRPEARGKGLGQALMNQSISSAKEMRYKQIYLESLPEFAKAVSMYEKMGFTLLEKPLGDSGHGSCTVWMIMELDAL